MVPWTPTYGQTDHLVSTFDELLKEMLEPIQSKGQLVHGQLDDHTFDLGRGVWKYTVNGGDRIGTSAACMCLETMLRSADLGLPRQRCCLRFVEGQDGLSSENVHPPEGKIASTGAERPHKKATLRWKAAQILAAFFRHPALGHVEQKGADFVWSALGWCQGFKCVKRPSKVLSQSLIAMQKQGEVGQVCPQDLSAANHE